MRLSRKTWSKYVAKLSAVNKTAGRKMQEWIDKHGTGDVDALVAYAYALTTKYGEASSALACDMYDAVAAAEGARVPPAEPKPTQNVKYVDKAIRSTLDRAPTTVPSTVSEMVKRTGAETTLKNAVRDGAYFAWVPNGDTCPFCITLASNGWRRASKKTVNGDHAEHIHKNCDCEFAISFNGPGKIEGYDPDEYLAMYEGAEGDTWKDKVNSMRREHYAANKDAVNAQKRAAYAARKKREGVAKDKQDGKIKPDKVMSGHDNTPKVSDPGIVVDRLGRDGETETRSFYNERGYKQKDITNHDHGHPKQHQFGEHGEHAHDYEWNDDGTLKSRTIREITDDERRENSDIL